MTTKELYKILDKALPSNIVYNLRKIRNVPHWRIQVWVKSSLDKLGSIAPYVKDELYPEYYEITDTITDFVYICNLALKHCAK